MESVGVWEEDGEYEGDIEGGMPCGEGCFRNSRSMLTGTWVDGRPFGCAVIHRFDGLLPLSVNSRTRNSQITDCSEILIHQEVSPLLTLISPWIIYTGRIHDFRANGDGTLTFATGSVLTGTFKEGFPDGECTLQHPWGDYAIGVYRVGMPHGVFKLFSSIFQAYCILQFSHGEPVGVALRIPTGNYFSPRDAICIKNAKFVHRLLEELREEKGM